MDNAAIIAGHSLCLPYAQTSEELITRLRQGEQVAASGWFVSESEALKGGFKGNKRFVRLPAGKESLNARLSRLIDNALAQAQLDKGDLKGEKVRVYLTGLGPRVDVKDYKSFYDRNDVEDIKLTPGITRLQLANMSQDRLSHHLAQKYGLRYLPPNLNCASNSSLAAVHIGCAAIEKGGVELVMVVSCSALTTQDFWFLESQSMLEGDVVQPFGEQSKSVLFAEGFCVLLLESHRHRAARQITAGVRLQSVYQQIGANRSNDAAYLTANLLKLIRQVLHKAEVTVQDLCAIIPHGNGSESSDKAEGQALALLLADCSVPVLAYKGQMGYTATGSGVVDLIIAQHALAQDELIPARQQGAIVKTLAQHLMTGGETVKHRKQHLLKVGVSVDGALIAVLMSVDRRGKR